MTGFYCMPSPRVWRGKRASRSEGDGVDLYAPGTPGYRKRTRETHTEISPGMVRVDLGEPITRQSHEAQPVTFEVPEEPEDGPLGVNETVAEAPAPSAKVYPAKDWRHDYGVARNH